MRCDPSSSLGRIAGESGGSFLLPWSRRIPPPGRDRPDGMRSASPPPWLDRHTAAASSPPPRRLPHPLTQKQLRCRPSAAKPRPDALARRDSPLAERRVSRCFRAGRGPGSTERPQRSSWPARRSLFIGLSSGTSTGRVVRLIGGRCVSGMRPGAVSVCRRGNGRPGTLKAVISEVVRHMTWLVTERAFSSRFPCAAAKADIRGARAQGVRKVQTRAFTEAGKRCTGLRQKPVAKHAPGCGDARSPRGAGGHSLEPSRNKIWKGHVRRGCVISRMA